MGEVIFIKGLEGDRNQFLRPEGMEKPGNVPDTWEIYNAPRPLYGHVTWQGNFRHGIFYAAIDPEGDYADEYRERTLQLDGSRCVFVTVDDVEEWATNYIAELNERYARIESHEEIKRDDFDFGDILKSYLQHR